jgi:hypothetical protein
MPDDKTFYAERYFREQLRALRRPGAEFDPWLADALELLVDHVKLFPPPDFEDSFIIEYVYPH